MPNETPLQTSEGPAAWTEAIAYLKAAKPVAAQKWSDALWLAATDHCKDQGATGATGHFGADESNPGTRAQRWGTIGGGLAENIAYG